MTNTDIVAWRSIDKHALHGYKQFFPKGWLELAGIGQYAYHWMADQFGMNYQGALPEPLGNKECLFPQQDNRTHFTEWARTVLNQVKISKIESRMKP
uniref:Uncharacterized protein n=1 Tax=Rhizophora mucronata TaxID=61149 RepID=A0A2P2JPJ7_RHIMU